MGTCCIIGSPCAGKGTQCNLLSELGYTFISAGNLLREKYPKGTPERSLLDSGGLININIISELINNKIMELNFNIIIDGYPRTAEQANNLNDFLKKNNKPLSCVIVLDAEKKILLSRTRSRYFCNICQKTFNKKSKCCNINTIRRDDDTDEIFNKRYFTWKESLENLIKIFDCHIYYIDTNKDINSIKNEILIQLSNNTVIK